MFTVRPSACSRCVPLLVRSLTCASGRKARPRRDLSRASSTMSACGCITLTCGVGTHRAAVPSVSGCADHAPRAAGRAAGGRRRQRRPCRGRLPALPAARIGGRERGEATLSRLTAPAAGRAGSLSAPAGYRPCRRPRADRRGTWGRFDSGGIHEGDRAGHVRPTRRASPGRGRQAAARRRRGTGARARGRRRPRCVASDERSALPGAPHGPGAARPQGARAGQRCRGARRGGRQERDDGFSPATRSMAASPPATARSPSMSPSRWAAWRRNQPT